jgi:hypothetical protein
VQPQAGQLVEADAHVRVLHVRQRVEPPPVQRRVGRRQEEAACVGRARARRKEGRCTAGVSSKHVGTQAVPIQPGATPAAHTLRTHCAHTARTQGAGDSEARSGSTAARTHRTGGTARVQMAAQRWRGPRGGTTWRPSAPGQWLRCVWARAADMCACVCVSGTRCQVCVCRVADMCACVCVSGVRCQVCVSGVGCQVAGVRWQVSGVECVLVSAECRGCVPRPSMATSDSCRLGGVAV